MPSIVLQKNPLEIGRDQIPDILVMLFLFIIFSASVAILTLCSEKVPEPHDSI